VGSDNRRGHQRKTLEQVHPYLSVLHFSVGKTEAEKCRTDKYGPPITQILRYGRNDDQSPNFIHGRVSVRPLFQQIERSLPGSARPDVTRRDRSRPRRTD